MHPIVPPRPPRFRRHLRRAATALAAGFALFLAGCGGASSGGDAPGGGELTKVTFLNVLPIESLTFTPEIIAQADGFFEREGLDVEFQVTRGSAQAIQTVIAGSALVTRVGDTEMMVALAGRDAPVTAVGQPLQQATIRMLSAADDPISAPADLRGHVIGIPSEGGTSETLVDTLARTAGLTDADVQKQVVGLSPGVFELVQQGRIDAYLVALDTAVAVQRQQPDAVVLDPSQVIAGGTQVYMTSQATVADPAQRDVVARFLRAVRAAQESVVADTSLDSTLQKLGDAYDIPILREPEVAKETLRQYTKSWQATGELLRIDPEQWGRVYEEAAAEELVPGGLDPNTWFTNDLLTGAAS
jgi:NitT/TauT family transport system substrate-binding protein